MLGNYFPFFLARERDKGGKEYQLVMFSLPGSTQTPAERLGTTNKSMKKGKYNTVGEGLDQEGHFVFHQGK